MTQGPFFPRCASYVTPVYCLTEKKPLTTVRPNSDKILRNCKKGKRKVQGVPQSQTAALPRPQEEEETDKSKQAQTEQTYEKH